MLGLRVLDPLSLELGHCVQKVVLCSCLVGCLVGLTGCQDDKTLSATAMPTVAVSLVQQKDVPVYREWIGVLDGSINAVLRPQVSGYLIAQRYREGQFVKKGQVLFEIDARTFEAAYKQAEAALDQARAELSRLEANAFTAAATLKRMRPLAQKNAVAKKDLDDAIGRDLAAKAEVEAARAGILMAEAKLERAELDLGFTRVTSPVDGIAGVATAQLGDLVGPGTGTELTRISTVDPIRVYINISEQHYLKAQAMKGRPLDEMPLELLLSDGSSFPQKGHFILADRQVDPTTGTLRLGASFANPKNILRPGQYGRIRAMVQLAKGALLIPQRAVNELQGRYLVSVINPEKKVEVRQVTVGPQFGADWVITKGLQAGEQVIVEGQQKARPGMQVKLREYVAQPPAHAAAARR